MTPALDEAGRRELAAALAALHRRDGLVVRAADLLGRIGTRMLHPFGITKDHPVLTTIAEAALERAYDVAILGLDMPIARTAPSLPFAAASGSARSNSLGQGHRLEILIMDTYVKDYRSS